MMKAAHVAEFYSAYLDGTLPERLRQRVETHLHACPQCAAELDDLRLMLDDLAAMPAPELPANFAAGVRAHLGAPIAPRRVFPWRIPVFAGAALAAAAVLLLIFSPRVNGPSGPIGTVPTPTIQPSKPMSAPAPRHADTDRQLAATPDPFAGNPAPTGTQTPSTMINDMGEHPHAAKLRTGVSSSGADFGKMAAKQPTSAQPVEVALAPPSPALDNTPTYMTKSIPDAAAAPDGIAAGAPTSPPAVAAEKDKDDLNKTMAVKTFPDFAGDTSANGEKGSTEAFDQTMQASRAAAGAKLESTSRNTLSIRLLSTFANGSSPSNPREHTDATTSTFDAAASAPAHRMRTSLEYTANTSLLRVTAGRSDLLSVTYANPRSDENAQVYLPGKPTDVLLHLPSLPAGTAVKLSLTDAANERMGESFYLVIPGNMPRLQTMTLQLHRQPRLQALLPIANAGGWSLLCPAAFADAPTTISISNMTPRAALQKLAREAHSLVEMHGNRINILMQR